MRTIVVSTFLSLDGVMQAPGGPEEDPADGFDQGGWSVNYWDDRMGEVMGGFMGEPFDLLLGRKTDEIFPAYWPHASGEEGADPLNAATKYVVATTLERADWVPSVLIRDDVVARISRLKREDGPELQVHGSSRLLQTFIAHDLIDPYLLLVFPMLLGTGKRLFADGVVPAGLRLLDAETSTTGVVIAHYEPAGKIEPGSFALDRPSETVGEQPG